MIKICSSPHTLPAVAQHNYHDYANEKNVVDVSSNDDDNAFCHPRRIRTLFPVKLYEMLNKVEEDGYADIISWQPHGRCFVVHNPKAFRKILPIYFSLSKVPSFQRQLNLYGFSRLTHGRDKGGYYHEFFLRGKQFLVNKIQRIQVKGTGVRSRSNPDAEPNFWDMGWVGRCDTSLQCKKKNKSSEKILKVEEPSFPQEFQRGKHDDTLVYSFEGKQFHLINNDEMPKIYKMDMTIPEIQLDDILGDVYSFVSEDICIALLK